MSGFQDLKERAAVLEEVQQFPERKDEAPSEQQERISNMSQEMTRPLCIKEEPEDLLSSEEEEQLQEPEEDDIIKFTYFPDTVKGEDDEEGPQSSQFHQEETELMGRRNDGEDCGGPEAVRYFDMEGDAQEESEVKTEDLSEAETDDSIDWMETTEHMSDLNSEENITNERTKTGRKAHCCSECGQIFKQKCHLINHMRTHTGEKPFSCSECGKTFKQQGHLKGHIRIHTGEKPFSCPECGKGFYQNNYLTRHMLYAHTSEKPFGCPECEKRFNSKSNLTMHMVVHTRQKSYSCSECGKCFYQNCHLTRHMVVHSGERPFKCPECEKCFSQKHSMIKHIRIHNQETHSPAPNEERNVPKDEI